MLHDGTLHIWIEGAWVPVGGAVSQIPVKKASPGCRLIPGGMRRSAWGKAPIYECVWYCNSNAVFTWQYEIDVNGDGNWMDIAEHPQKTTWAFSPSGEFPNQLTLANTKQEERYPNALMRYRIRC